MKRTVQTDEVIELRKEPGSRAYTRRIWPDTPKLPIGWILFGLVVAAVAHVAIYGPLTY